MAKLKKRKTAKKTKRLKVLSLRKSYVKKPAKRRKVFNIKSKIRKNKIKRKITPKKKIIIRKKIKLKKIIKKPVQKRLKRKSVKIKKVHPVKSRKARISPKAKLFNRVKKIIVRKKKTHRIKLKKTEFQPESLFKAKIKVIGIGGGGGSIVSEIGRSLEKATFVVADTDIRALKKKSGIKYFWFGQDLTHGLGTGVDVDLAKQAAESAREKISGIFKDQDIIIFVASLGGGLGSGATQVFAETAREFGGITFGIFTMPFKFEGKNKYRIAQNALKSLRKSLNVSLVIPNEKIFKIIDESTPITNAFSTVNKSLIESLESLIDLIYNPGIINIDFADLRTILRGIGNSAFLNTVEGSGKDRAEKICQNIFKNLLLQNSGFKVEKILFNISGGENLSMFEVEKISSHIANLHSKAKIIFGISKNPKLKNRIKTTILMTGGQIEEHIPIKKIEPTEEKPKEIKLPIKKETTVVKNKKPKKNIPVPQKKPVGKNKKLEKPVSFIPVFEVPELKNALSMPVLDQKKIDIVETANSSAKKTIRRSGLEIRKAEESEEKKRLAQEKEWEIPAFLRKVKFRG